MALEGKNLPLRGFLRSQTTPREVVEPGSSSTVRRTRRGENGVVDPEESAYASIRQRKKSSFAPIKLVGSRFMRQSVIELELSTAELAEALDVDNAASEIVAVNRDQLAAISDQVRGRPDFHEFSPAKWDDAAFWNVEDSPVQRSQFMAIGTAINFRFWELVDGRMLPTAGEIEGKSYRGAMFMWRALRRFRDRERDRFFAAATWADITKDQFEEIFRDEVGRNPLAPGLEERVANLRDLGGRLAEDWDGWFFNLVQSSDASLVRFSRLCASIRAFDDPLYKLTMLNAILHSGSGIYQFHDEPLPAIDYHLVRHALRQGILVPNESIEAKLKNARLLHDFEASELRRVALAVFVELSARTQISGEILDNKFWLNRVNCTDEAPVCTNPETASLCPFFGACAQITDFGRPLELTRYY